MINIPLPATIQDFLVRQTMVEILRRSLDTTVLPIFVDSNLRVNIGATSGSIERFYSSIVSGFNRQVNFYDNLTCQRNACISGDMVVSGLLSAGTIICNKIIVKEIIQQ